MSQKRRFRRTSAIAAHRSLLLFLSLALILGMACDSSDTPTDRDQDGVNDILDAFPDDPTETEDSDADGVGDNADVFPDDATETADGDGDGVGNNADAFPQDADESVDTDSDGVGDNADVFPDDATETADGDGDGVGNNADAFPQDANESADTDSDGVGDNADVFPDDATETADGDGDGVGNNADAFPQDANESADTDSDGVGDNADAFPQDDTEWADADADGVGDRLDAYPEDSEEATYGSVGPYVVGVTSLSMGDRNLEVFYPAEDGSQDGLDLASYELIDPFPQEIQDLIITLAPGANATVVIPAYRDLPSHPDGPFPVLTFSHGSGGFPRAYSKLLSGIAAFGITVISINHLEWGLLDRLNLGLPEEDQREADELVLSALALLDSESQDPDSLLSGAADTDQVATAGHSAGGQAAFAFPTPDNPEIKTLIGYATVPFSVTTDKPVLLLLGEDDFAITAEATLSSYDALVGTKRYVAVANAAHNSFTDQCEVIYDGNDIIAAAQLIFGAAFPESLAALARDGCLPENLAPSEFWRITQHYTVAHLKRVFLLNEEPRGLTARSAELFGETEIDYRFQEE